jgi:hypothetical protein
VAESVTAEPLIAYRRAPRTFRRDRICSTLHCVTHLSIYNAGDYCAVHGPDRSWSLTEDIALDARSSVLLVQDEAAV